MRIDKAEVIVTSPDRNFVTLRLITDDGLGGLGDATLNGRELSLVAYLREHVMPLLLAGTPTGSKTPGSSCTGAPTGAVGRSRWPRSPRSTSLSRISGPRLPECRSISCWAAPAVIAFLRTVTPLARPPRAVRLDPTASGARLPRHPHPDRCPGSDNDLRRGSSGPVKRQTL